MARFRAGEKSQDTSAAWGFACLPTGNFADFHSYGARVARVFDRKFLIFRNLLAEIAAERSDAPDELLVLAIAMNAWVMWIGLKLVEPYPLDLNIRRAVVLHGTTQNPTKRAISRTMLSRLAQHGQFGV